MDRRGMMKADRKPKIYLDTSIPNHLFADDRPDWMAATWRLWEKCKAGEYDIFVSDLFFEELDDCEEPKRSWMYEKLGQIPFTVLQESEKVTQLAQKYLENGLLSEKKLNDRLHIAYAATNDCDAILSWNFRDIVNDATRSTVKIVNAICRYSEMLIVSPEIFLEGGFK
jgi:predicted nucleic acid-binding protein